MAITPFTGSKYRREEFDRSREFICCAGNFLCNGRNFSYGDRFQKNLVTTRRLRQLYESRKLDMLPPEETYEDGDGPENVEMIDFDLLPAQAIHLWLEQNNVVMRLGTKKPKLVDKAKQVWEELYGTPKAPENPPETGANQPEAQTA